MGFQPATAEPVQGRKSLCLTLRFHAVESYRASQGAPERASYVEPEADMAHSHTAPQNRHCLHFRTRHRLLSHTLAFLLVEGHQSWVATTATASLATQYPYWHAVPDSVASMKTADVWESALGPAACWNVVAQRVDLLEQAKLHDCLIRCTMELRPAYRTRPKQ